MADIVSSILDFHRPRDPERVAMKYAAMRSDAFVFLRGTCHLYYARLPASALPAGAPAIWNCGDLHVQNFGCYRGDNGLIYFDINDFDEAILGPCTLDLVRLLSSVLIAAAAMGADAGAAQAHAAAVLATYRQTLASGRAGWIERETATGAVRALIKGATKRSREDLLDSRAETRKKTRRLRLDGIKALPVSDAQRARVNAFVGAYAETTAEPGCYRVIDVARRIAGNGSLGTDRYVILVEGRGSPDKNWLLDLKQATPSSLSPQVATAQPSWPSQAARMVTVQSWLQAVPPAFLDAVDFADGSYVLRDLQPVDDRIAFDASLAKRDRLPALLADMARLTAWAHLRGSGRGGAATADALIAFAADDGQAAAVLELAGVGADQVREDWRTYCRAYDDGAFGKKPKRPRK